MKNKASGIPTSIFLALNLLFAVLLPASAFGGFVNPHTFPWIVVLTLLFPVLLIVNFTFMLVWLIVFSRKWLLSFAAILACVCQIRTYCPINIPQPTPKDCIKIACYNIYSYGGLPTDSDKYQNMLSYLGNSDADIFCAQEAHTTIGRQKDVDRATAHWKHRDTLNIGKSFNALMLCSNFPIIDRKVLPSSSEGHVCVIYRLKAEGDTIAVANCHYVSNKINPEDKQVYHDILTATERDRTDILNICRKINEAGIRRAEQADTLLHHLQLLGDMPMIVCGDFNDSPLSYVHNRLTGRLNDAYTESGNGPGITYHRSAMFFRLDNILCSHHWRAFNANVDSRQKMSDHYPIEVWLKRVE